MRWDDKVVIVTGATGSFGRKFTEILTRDFRPKKLIIFSRDELKQHEMRQIFPEDGLASRRLQNGFQYASDNNTQLLTVEQLQKLIGPT